MEDVNKRKKKLEDLKHSIYSQYQPNTKANEASNKILQNKLQEDFTEAFINQNIDPSSLINYQQYL